ncbi:hypothetical protein C0J52_21810 [Blattella germanica]|nr:hypothetical protein C0J52_21810 [Blattella germanica]
MRDKHEKQLPSPCNRIPGSVYIISRIIPGSLTVSIHESCSAEEQNELSPQMGVKRNTQSNLQTRRVFGNAKLKLAYGTIVTGKAAGVLLVLIVRPLEGGTGVDIAEVLSSSCAIRMDGTGACLWPGPINVTTGAGEKRKKKGRGVSLEQFVCEEIYGLRFTFKAQEDKKRKKNPYLVTKSPVLLYVEKQKILIRVMDRGIEKSAAVLWSAEYQTIPVGLMSANY